MLKISWNISPAVFAFAALVMLVTVFALPRRFNQLSADHAAYDMHALTCANPAVPQPTMGYAYPQQAAYAPAPTYYGTSNTYGGSSYTTNDPYFAQRQFDSHYGTQYPSYSQSMYSYQAPAGTTAGVPVPASGGYGYVTSNPGSENDPLFAMRSYDAYYAPRYPYYNYNYQNVPGLRTQPTMPFPLAY